jgi:hypothetical protein
MIECECHGDENSGCNGTFWCTRHAVWKSQHSHKLCQTRENYFRAWEEGRGLGQLVSTGVAPQPGGPHGPGLMLAKLLGCQSGFSRDHIHAMDQWGCEMCLERIDTIIGWITEPREGLTPMCEDAARRLIVLAVERAVSEKVVGRE